jgi:hypothetical protein
LAFKKRTWLWIIFGAIGFMALCLVALVGGGIYFVSRHVKTELVGQNTAEEQFLRQRERFAGQQPLVEVEGADKADVQARVRRSPESAPKVELHTMRVLVYNSREGRLIHVDLPFWLLRIMPGSLNNASNNFSFDSHHITVDDIERHGPGLILDARDSRDAQVLIWAD